MIDSTDKKEYSWEELKSLVHIWNEENSDLLSKPSDYKIRKGREAGYACDICFEGLVKKDVDK